MQWSENKNAGFSQSDTTIRPLINNGSFSYQFINVTDEEKDTSALLCWLCKMIALRNMYQEVSMGNWKIMQTNNKHVLTVYYSWNKKQLLTIHNFSKESQRVRIRGIIGIPNIISPGNVTSTLNRDGTYNFDLEGYDYGWFNVE